MRELRLFDDDPRSNKNSPPAYARYVQIGRTRRADIELYFWRLSGLQDELRKNPMYVMFLLIRSFSHELFHHRIRAQRVVRRPKENIEERRADAFAQRAASRVVHQLFPRQKYASLWRTMEEALNSQEVENDALA